MQALARFYRGLTAAENSLQSVLLLIVRLYWGWMLVHEAWVKLHWVDLQVTYFTSLGIPLPTLCVYLVLWVQLIAGALLFLGLFARMAAIPLVIILVVALFNAHYSQPVGFVGELLIRPQPFLVQTGILYLYAALLVLCFGPGKVSIDYLFWDRRKPKR